MHYACLHAFTKVYGTFMMRCSALPLRSDSRMVDACAMTCPPTCGTTMLGHWKPWRKSLIADVAPIPAWGCAA